MLGLSEFLVGKAMAQVAERIAALLVPFAAELERLCTIPGVKQVAAAAILAEIGTDMSQFPSTADLDSWAGMALGNNQSGGKRHRAKARKGNRWLRTILVESGNAAGRTRNTALSALYRRMIVRGGHKHAAFVAGRNHDFGYREGIPEISANRDLRESSDTISRARLRMVPRLGEESSEGPSGHRVGFIGGVVPYVHRRDAVSRGCRASQHFGLCVHRTRCAFKTTSLIVPQFVLTVWRPRRVRPLIPL
jgi:hypothetical protein